MIKKGISWIHRWLGIITGLVVIIISLTGCIYVFVDELKAVFYRDRLFVQTTHQTTQPLSVLMANARQALGKEIDISRCDIYPSADRSWIFRAIKTNPDAIGHWNYYEYYYRVYMNPYTGSVIQVEDTRNEFFQLVLSLHTDMLLGHRIGQPLVGICVLIFIVLLLSGLVLWWPKKGKKKALKQAFTIKWKAKFKRINYDLHNTLGFYVLVPALIITLTGTVYSFKWMDASIYAIFSGGKQKTERRPSPIQTSGTTIALDRALSDVLNKYPKADMISTRFSRQPGAPYDFQVRLQPGRTYHFNWLFYNATTGHLLSSYGTADLQLAEKVRALNFDLHVGSFAGLPGKILGFCICLICASLPITGFIIWLRPKKKKNKLPKLLSS